MDIVDFHMLIRAENRDEQITDLENALGGLGSVDLMARRNEHHILRIKAPSEAFLFLKLKYGNDNVWLR